jgi:hypothetical protein
MKAVVLDQLRKGNRSVDLAGRNLAPSNPRRYEDEALSVGMRFGNVSFERTDDGIRVRDTFDYNFGPLRLLSFMRDRAQKGDLSALGVLGAEMVAQLVRPITSEVTTLGKSETLPGNQGQPVRITLDE